MFKNGYPVLPTVKQNTDLVTDAYAFKYILRYDIPKTNSSTDNTLDSSFNRSIRFSHTIDVDNRKSALSRGSNLLLSLVNGVYGINSVSSISSYDTLCIKQYYWPTYSVVQLLQTASYTTNKTITSSTVLITASSTIQVTIEDPGWLANNGTSTTNEISQMRALGSGNRVCKNTESIDLKKHFNNTPDIRFFLIYLQLKDQFSDVLKVLNDIKTVGNNSISKCQLKVDSLTSVKESLNKQITDFKSNGFAMLIDIAMFGVLLKSMESHLSAVVLQIDENTNKKSIAIQNLGKLQGKRIKNS